MEEPSRYIIVGSWNMPKRLRVYRVVRETAGMYEVDSRIRSTGEPRRFLKEKCCAIARSKEEARKVADLHQQAHRAVSILLSGYKAQVPHLVKQSDQWHKS